MEEIEEHARSQAEKENWLLVGIEVCVFFGFTVVEAVLASKLATVGKELLWYILIPLLLIAVIHIYLGILIIRTQFRIPRKFYFDYKDIYEENGYLRTILKQSHQTAVAINLSLSAINNFQYKYKDEEELSTPQIKKGVEDILKPLIDFREEVFNFILAARYNFGVYLYSESEGVLKEFYRNADDRIPLRHRSWGKGQGHIGFCYANGETIVSSDVTRSPELLRGMDEIDKRNYRSMGSTPIFRGEEENLRGVFIVTSNVANQLGTEHEIVLQVISSILTLYFNFTDKKGGEPYV